MASQGKSAQDKGKRAERAVREALAEICGRVASELGVDNLDIQRNLQQSINGGCDIAGIPWCAIEVKHHEQLQLPKWWIQCQTQAQALKVEPVLIYKRNNVPFRVRLFATLQVWNGTQVKVLSDIAFDDYLVYFEQQARAYFMWLRGTGGAQAAP